MWSFHFYVVLRFSFKQKNSEPNGSIQYPATCIEVLKEISISFIRYRMRQFHRKIANLDNILQDPNQATSTNKEQNHLNTVSNLEAHKIFDETSLRIGPPNENLIRHRANLLEQLEIEAEFEDNIEKGINSEANIKQIDKNLNQTNAPPVTVDSADNVLFNDLFIAQTQYDLNDTSRGSQTIKTSLGKKSKLRNVSESQPESSNAPYSDQEQQDKELLDKLYMNKDFEINNENVDCITVPLKDESPSYDEEYDHERN